MIDALVLSFLTIALLPWYGLVIFFAILCLLTWAAGDPKDSGRGLVLLPLILVVAAYLWYIGKVGATLSYIAANPLSIIAGAIIWTVIGVVWSGYFWYKVQVRALEKYQREHSNYPDGRNPDGRNPDGRIRKEMFIPNFSDYKDAIICRVILWPFSVINDILSDLVYDALVWIVGRFRWWYNAIHRMVWGDLA